MRKTAAGLSKVGAQERRRGPQGAQAGAGIPIMLRIAATEAMEEPASLKPRMPLSLEEEAVSEHVKSVTPGNSPAPTASFANAMTSLPSLAFVASMMLLAT